MTDTTIPPRHTPRLKRMTHYAAALEVFMRSIPLTLRLNGTLVTAPEAVAILRSRFELTDTELAALDRARVKVTTDAPEEATR